MLSYLTIIPVSVLIIFNIIYLWKMRKDDKILYQFCELRRQIMSILRRNYNTINTNDFQDAKELLLLTNHMIHYYKEHKETTFDLFWFVDAIKKTRKSSEDLKKRAPIKNKGISKLYSNFGYILIIAFLDYTLFLRSRIVIKMLIKVMEVLAKTSIKWTNKVFDYLLWLDTEVNQYNTSKAH